MNATIKLENENHFPVLLEKLISIISPLYGGTFIDCTFGEGGYSKKILEHSNNNVVALDRDIENSQYALKIKKKFKEKFNFINTKFSELDNLNLEKKNIKAIIFDLGYSTSQIKNLSKGLSFQSKGELNMKLGLNNFSASDVINKLDYKDLHIIFSALGEEKKSKIIARKIIEFRNKKKIKTEELVKIIHEIKKNQFMKIHRSTKIFQALRIFVNKEMSELIYGLINSFKILPIGGMIVVVTFHSLEDRIVKFFFKNYSENKNSSRYIPNTKKNKILFKIPQKKPIIPDIEEIKKNPPSRSAKLRYAIRSKNQFIYPDNLIQKFNKYLKIEAINV